MLPPRHHSIALKRGSAVWLVLSLVACEGKRNDRASVPLPAGGRYSSVVLTTRWFSGGGGGPNQGYDLAIEPIQPKSPAPNLAIVSALGKDSLDTDPMFLALKRPTLKLTAAPDGHAVAWTIDGKTWHAAYLDGPRIFVCSHQVVNPDVLPPTNEVVLSILSTATHPLPPIPMLVRSDVHTDWGQEYRGALMFALHPGGDETLSKAAQAWMTDDRHARLRADTGLNDLSELLEDEYSPEAD